MSTVLAALQAQAAQAAAVGPNMTEAVAGGASRLLPEGYAFARLVEYVEFGMQPQEYLGKAKDPAMEVQLGFALWGQGYQNDDGTPYIVRPYSFGVSRNEKAKAFKTFAVLNWTGTATHFAQLLGQAFLVKIVHIKAKDGSSKVSSRLDLASTLPPLDPVTKQPYQIPMPSDDLYKLFLWDIPTLEAWDALFIEGNWDDGKSKNRVQETILSAVDFDGSALDVLLRTANRQINKPQAPMQAPTAPAVPSVMAPQGVGIPALPIAPGNALPQASVGDAFAALPCTPAPASSGAPASPTIPETTSHSNPVLPSLPTLPTIPGIPQ